ncbi:hypothetical protein [Streptomyces sp. Da 82-17]|uniref:hypothetical protein n=1 Tax=Streptomyces sp. Da 82-17 TaxID=3377116 RepID=UPI0038D405AE
MTEVEFIGPPPRQRNTKHFRIAAALRGNADAWGVVARRANITRAASAAQAIKSGRLAAYAPAGRFEAVARTVVVDGVEEHRVYARYVSDKAAQ